MSCSDDIPAVEEDFKIKEKILSSNPSQGPTLEIVEIEFKNIGSEGQQTQYQDSLRREKERNFKEMNIFFWHTNMWLHVTFM